ncbi:MAG: hypothetical protein KGK11_05015 [Sphingomonadales bacterium]|nr:hypothetical protein [Sphingomonadales bacterium]
MSRLPAEARPAGADRGARAVRLILAGSLLAPLVLLTIARQHQQDITTLQLLQQDVWLLLAGLGLAVALALPARPQTALPVLSRGRVAALALIVAAAGYAGHYAILDGYDLSRDEQMADFDAIIYAAGRLAWPLPRDWQAPADLLNTQFMLPVLRPAAWVSGYLPGNAMLRALFGSLGDRALTGALLNGLSVGLLWICARRIWPTARPRDREAVSVAVLLLVLSGEFVLTGMSAYAMPAHLACDLGWLALFLRDRRRADLAALAVGFVAVGLHQPLFHPLFVAPFLVLLVWQRRRDRLWLYGPAYAAIAAFWFFWPHLTLALVSGPQSAVHGTGAGYVARLFATLAENRDNLPIMAANLLRFLTWQHILLLPLLIAGCLAAPRRPLAMALAAGFFLPILVMAVIEPRQGHGFGYRYIYGVLGNATLLGGYGWRWLAPRVPRLPAIFIRASIGTLLVMLPMQLVLTHRLYATYARADARLSASGADYVILGEEDAPLALDLVHNRPDLANRPLRLVAGEIGDRAALAQRLCRPARGGPVIVALVGDGFYRDVMRFYGWPARGFADRRLAGDIADFRAAGCRVRVLV